LTAERRFVDERARVRAALGQRTLADPAPRLGRRQVHASRALARCLQESGDALHQVVPERAEFLGAHVERPGLLGHVDPRFGWQALARP